MPVTAWQVKSNFHSISRDSQLLGPFEELSDAQIKTQMDVNFFGLIAVTRKAMDVMRDQKPSGGLIQQVTSIGGQRGYAGSPIQRPCIC